MYSSNSFESFHQSQTHSINIVAAKPLASNKRTSLQSQIPMRPSSHHVYLPKKDSLVYSTTNPIKKPAQVPSSIKQNKIEVQTSQKGDQQVFIKYYEQNLQLKKKQDEMMREMKELREKVNSKNEYSRVILEEELKALAQGKKSEWDVTKKPLEKQKRGQSSGKNLSTKKVEHLLEIIDHYKAKLITAEEQTVNLRRQKYILEQDIKLKDKKYQSLQEDKNNGGDFQEELNLSDKLKRSIRELELEKERAKFLEMAVKSLETKLRSSELKSQEMDSLKAENMALEEKVIRMTQLPNFSNVVDKAEEQRKGKQLQAKLKLLNEKYNSLRDNSFKTEADLKILQNKLIESTHEIAALQSQNQSLRAQSVNNPILQKLNKDPELIQKILWEIEQKKKSAIRQPENSKEKIQKLILQKEELAKMILNYQTRIQTLEESYKERQKLSKFQKPETLVEINQGKTTSFKQGVLYDGDTSAFSEQNINIPTGSNYFDLYLGEVSLLETMVQSATGLSNPSSPLLLATVDFYNHNTQSSKLAQGCRCDLQSEIFFKVNEDDFFIKYLQKNSFHVDVWASEGNKHYHMGKATIDLKHLITKARPRVSPVISTSAPLYLNQKILGSINLIMRMRLPIYDQVQRLLKDNSANAFQAKEETTMRKLVIQVDQGRGFGQKSNTFVYYPFRLQDHYTRPSKGNNPSWNHIKMMEVSYDIDFKNYLRKGQLEFIVFDDNVIVMDDKNMDVVGSAILSLAPLLEGKAIRERLQIKKGNQRKGTIDVKIFWYEVEDNSKDLVQLEEERKLSPQGVHQQIKSFMKEHNVDADKVFRLMDDNKTGLVSFDEFQEWIFKITSRKFTAETVSKYYKGFKEPLNIKNFLMRINQQFDSQGQKEQQSVAAGIGMINQFLKINTTQIKKTPLEDYLQGKNVVEIVGNMETDRAGYISKEKLQQFLDKNGLEASIGSERIKLIDFLRKHKKMNLTI